MVEERNEVSPSILHYEMGTIKNVLGYELVPSPTPNTITIGDVDGVKTITIELTDLD